MNRRDMKIIWIILLLAMTVQARPYHHQRTFRVPNLMEIVARKMGIVDFFANFVRGIRSMFNRGGGGGSSNQLR